VAGAAWLKSVPPFFAHEGPLIRLLAADGAPVPLLLATDGHRSLFDELPGVDLWEAPRPVLAGLVRSLVEVQARWADRVERVLDLGTPDWRPAAGHRDRHPRRSTRRPARPGHRDPA